MTDIDPKDLRDLDFQEVAYGEEHNSLVFIFEDGGADELVGALVMNSDLEILPFEHDGEQYRLKEFPDDE